MPVKRKNTVEYFPHYVNSSAKKHAIEGKYGAVGYVFWFKLLEVLCQSGTFSLSWDNIAQRDWLITETFTNEQQALEILDYLAKINAIDAELWKNHLVWVQKLIDNLNPVFIRRIDKTVPIKPPFLNNLTPNNKIKENRIEVCEHNANIMRTSCKHNDNINATKTQGKIIKLTS